MMPRHFDPRESTSADGAPALTIGMPLHNNARTLRRALDSLLAQTMTDFELIASDDCSTDGTREIIERYARADARIRVFHQPVNLNYGNFRYVLQRARSPFFMFAAGDDWWEPHFAATGVETLRRTPSAVAAMCRVMKHPEGEPTSVSAFTQTISGEPAERIVRFLSDPGDNSRMYAVFRTEIARRAFPASDHHAYDWTFSAASLLYGDHLQVLEIGMHREVTPGDRYVHYVARDNSWLWDRLFPLAPMTRTLLFEYRIPATFAVLHALYDLNMAHHYWYVQTFHPWIDRAHQFRRTVWRRVRSALRRTHRSGRDRSMVQ